MNNLAHYVRVYDNVFSEEFCKGLVDTFEKKDQEFKTLRTSEHTWKEDYRSFTEVNITQENQYEEYVKPYYAKIREVYNHYRKVTDIHFFPDQFALEDARLKMYRNDDHDQFGWHVDIGDKSSSSRYLVMFTYLNDVIEGGETEFESKSEIDFAIKPKCGRIVVFPPTFMFPHRGKKPISNNKYILSTYCHYL